MANTNNKYLSVITNFGCHYKCPYCIVRKNDLKIPETTVDGLDNLKEIIKENNIGIVSISGGGDPLHEYEKHVDYYNALIYKLDAIGIPYEMHTSYLHSDFPISKCKRVVYHIRHLKDIEPLKRIRKVNNETIRIVFVVQADTTMEEISDIAIFVRQSNIIDELSFRQMVNSNYKTEYYWHLELKYGHRKGLWHYIEQNDYNLYYINGKVFTRFSEIR